MPFLDDEPLARQFELSLPKERGGLYLEHNPHHGAYESVAEHLKFLDATDDEFPEGEQQRAIDTDELWICQWYPNTPVGFNRMMASTLAALLDALRPYSSVLT